MQFIAKTILGSKRKTDLTQQDHDENRSEQRTRPVPRPVQKNTQRREVAMSPVTHNTKKRSSEAVDLTHENDPKTVQSKKAKKQAILEDEEAETHQQPKGE
jgi:hypothetical protein